MNSRGGFRTIQSVSRPAPESGGSKKLFFTLAVAVVAVVAFFIWVRRDVSSPPSAGAGPDPVSSRESGGAGERRVSSRSPQLDRGFRPGLSEEALARANAEVKDRLVQYSQRQRAVLHAYARHLGVPVLQDVDQFFTSLESGNVEEAVRRAERLDALRNVQQGSSAPGLDALWPVVEEARGVAEATRNWPAPALLEFGRALQDSLGPNTVLLAGGDAARFVPTLMENNGEGDGRLILAQSSFADGMYMNYARFQAGERLHLPDPGEVEQAFQAVVREHGKPDANGVVMVGGQDAVTAINEKLVAFLQAKNPEVRFAVQESHAMPSTHAGAELAGPLMVLGAGGDGKAPKVGPEEAARSVTYWQQTAERLRLDPALSTAPAVREGWAEMAIGQASVLASADRRTEAETLYRAAAELAPDSGQAAHRLAQWLASSGRAGEAIQILQTYVSTHPDNAQAVVAWMESIRSGKK